MVAAGRRVASLALGVLLTAACGTGAIAGRGCREGIAELALGRPAELGGLELTLVDVADSRCPRGAQCIRAGEVIATLDVARPGAVAARVELMLPAVGEPEVRPAHGCRLRLLSVEPYPAAGDALSPADRRARVEVLS